jgi:hypothetical protein
MVWKPDTNEAAIKPRAIELTITCHNRGMEMVPLTPERKAQLDGCPG